MKTKDGKGSSRCNESWNRLQLTAHTNSWRSLIGVGCGSSWNTPDKDCSSNCGCKGKGSSVWITGNCLKSQGETFCGPTNGMAGYLVSLPLHMYGGTCTPDLVGNPFGRFWSLPSPSRLDSSFLICFSLGFIWMHRHPTNQSLTSST